HACLPPFPTRRSSDPGLRPESLHVDGGPITPARSTPIDARLDVVEPMGAEIVLSARADTLELVARVPPQPLPPPDTPIRLLIDLDRKSTRLNSSHVKI